MNPVTIERIASLLAGIGSIWFSWAITLHFPKLLLAVLPPTGGPTELIGLSVLIWLWAKQRRVVTAREQVIANRQSA